MLTGEEFYQSYNPRFDKDDFLRPPKNKHEDYMELMEDYGDYVCRYEKHIDRCGLANLEALEIRMKTEGVRRVGDLKEFNEKL